MPHLDIVKNEPTIKRRFVFLWLVKRVLLILVVWLLLHMVYTVIDGLQQPKQTADIAVILGSKVNPDGKLSPRLVKRLERGLQLYQTHTVKAVMVSGGLGNEGFYEGTKMQEFLVQHGVNVTDIILDNQGDNTLKSIKNTINIMRQHQWWRVIVVSQYFHISRTKLLFKKLLPAKMGIMQVAGASPYYVEIRDVYSLVREFFAYYKTLWFMPSQ